MLAWLSWPAIFASSMSMVTNSSSIATCGKSSLIATMRSNPASPRVRARNTSAIPPWLMRSSSVYLPNAIGWADWFGIAARQWGSNPPSYRILRAGPNLVLGAAARRGVALVHWIACLTTPSCVSW